eukprot:6077023-Karenia_brevis.AAC.1
MAQEFASVEDVLPCEELVLFSLFDGIGSARRALELLKIKPGGYISADIKPTACRVVRYSWPDLVEVGDVLCIDEVVIFNLRLRYSRA